MTENSRGENGNDDIPEKPSPDYELDILEITREEARTTLDNQLKSINDIDRKASKILRLNVILIGIFLSVVSITVDAETGVVPLFNGYTAAGTTCLILSTIFASLTYSTSDTRTGMSSDDLRQILDGGYSDKKIREGIVESYASWIDFNYQTNIGNALLFTVTVLLLVFSVTLLSVGVVDALLFSVPLWLDVVVVVLLLLLAYFLDVHKQVHRWYTEVDHSFL